MLTLAIGDLYIPDRALELPSNFRKLLCPNPNSIPTNNKLSKVLCLGNINNSYDTLKFLYDLSPSFNIVRGESDDTEILSQQIGSLSKKETEVPTCKIIQHDNLKIGFTNGYLVVPKNDPLALLTLARELDVDILIWGGTHKVEAYTLDGKFFINPGSATGAFNFDWIEREEESGDEEGENKEDPDQETQLSKEELEAAEVKQKTEKNGVTEDKTNTNESETKDEPAKGAVDKDENDSESKTHDTDKKEDKVDAKDSNDDDTSLINEVEELTSFIPSFCLLDTHDSTCILYIYTYFHGEVKVDKVTYQKE